MTHKLVVALSNVSEITPMRHVFHLLLQHQLLSMPRLSFRLLVNFPLAVLRISLSRAMKIDVRANAEERRRHAGNNFYLHHVKIISFSYFIFMQSLRCKKYSLYAISILPFFSL